MQRVANYLSGELQTHVSVGGLDISFFLDIVLEDVLVLDHDQQPLMRTGKMLVDIERISLRKKYLSINRLILHEVYLGLSRQQQQDDFNFKFLLDYFSDDDPNKSQKERWEVNCKSFVFRDASFDFNDHHRQVQHNGFDFGHFAIEGFNLDIHDVFLDRESLDFNLAHLSFRESSSFSLEHLSGRFSIAPEQTRVEGLQIRSPLSDLSLDIVLHYNEYDALADFNRQVEMELQIGPSRVDLGDVSFFLPDMHGMGGPLDISGEFSGSVANLRANNLVMKYGQSTLFRGGFHLDGLPDLQETFINFYVDEFRTHAADISSLRLPLTAVNTSLQLPENLKNLGNLVFSGRLTGFTYDFMAFGQLNTDIGQANSDMRFKRKQGEDLLGYSGSLKATNFNLGLFLDRPEQIGKVSFSARLEGKGLSLESVDMDFNGQIEKMDLVSYDYHNLELSGSLRNRTFLGNLQVEDENLQLEFNGLISLQEEDPAFDFRAQIHHANLSRLNIYQRDSLASSAVSADILLQSKGGLLDDMRGSLLINDLVYYEMPQGEEQTRILFRDDLSLISEDLDNQLQRVILRSDFMEARLEGKVLFHRLVYSFRSFAANFLPAVFENNPVNGSPPGQEFSFHFQFRDTDVLSELFWPGLRISAGSTFSGQFNSRLQELVFQGRASELRVAGNRFLNWQVSGRQNQSHYTLNMESSRLMFTGTQFIDQFQWHTIVGSDTLLFTAIWDNHDIVFRSRGQLEGLAQFYGPSSAKLHLLPSFAYFDQSVWEIHPDNEILFDPSGIEIKNLMLIKNDESFHAHGYIGRDPERYLHLVFNEFNLDNFDFLLQDKNLEFAGMISGEISMAALHEAPSIHAGLEVKDFAFNGDHLGDLMLNSKWDHWRKAFEVDARILYYGNVGHNVPLVATGYFYPEQSEQNFDLDIRLENLKMSIFARYLKSFAEDFRGMASGNLRLEGPARAPKLFGRARLVRTGFRVAYLNTSYSFAHELEVGPDFFRVNNLVLTDTLGQSALVNGTVYHNHFRDFRVDVLIQPERMAVLNTTAAQNDLYYGRGFATGRAHIYGPASGIIMDISARTNRGTQIFLPLGDSNEVTESNFITFVSRDTSFLAQPLVMPDLSGITLNFDLEVTPDAEVQLIFDSQIGDIIRGRGAGNLKFEITPEGSFNMYGNYLIEEGDYLFTLQMINKRFRIIQGGSIRWAGDPYDADIDLRAVYRLRTPLYELFTGADTTDFYRRRVPVETVLDLKNKLFNPTISFGINLPGSDETTRELLERLITTEQEMNRQVFSLLVLNRFMPTSADQYNTALGYGVGSTSSELLSNQLSNWLSQISSDFDIGINYRPADEISSQELELALSTQLFHDRVIIDGNLGVAGNNPMTNQRASTLMGDVVIEVKITPEGKFRVKAFNRSNTFDMINTNSPYTQGVGVFYRKEFDSVRELFRRSRRPNPDPYLQEEEEEMFGSVEEE